MTEADFKNSQEELSFIDLFPGKTYKCTTNKKTTLVSLLKTCPSNGQPYHSVPVQGGIRPAKVQNGVNINKIAFLALISNSNSKKYSKWSDKFDPKTSILTYHGDNAKSTNILNTHNHGNVRLKEIFQPSFSNSKWTYPILYFESLGHDLIKFLGLALPLKGKIKQIIENSVPNYEVQFKIDMYSVVKRQWLIDLKQGKAKDSTYAPQS